MSELNQNPEAGIRAERGGGGLGVMLRTLKSRNYRLFFMGQGISLIGTWMQQVAMGWLAYRLTNSAFWLGFINFSARIPIFVLVPFAGVLADRWNRRRILVITQTLSMVQALALAALVITNLVQVWHLVALSLFLGLVNAMDTPARQAFIVDMIERKQDLGNAIALNSTIVNGARLVGPSVAGLLIAAVGEGWVFLINGLSYVAVIIALLAMVIPAQKREARETRVLAELMEGARYVFGFAPMRSILLLVSLVSLTGMPYVVLMPIFAKNIFHGGPHTLGFLMGAAGTGALVGALILASRRSALGLDRLIVWACLMFGGGLAGFAFSRFYWLSLVLLALTGFGMILQLASSNTVLQTLVDDDKRGRLMSFYTMAFMGMAPFGSLLAGSLAAKIGAPDTILVGGVASILGAAWFAARLPAMRRLMRPILAGKGLMPAAPPSFSPAAESGKPSTGNPELDSPSPPEKIR